MSGQENPPEFKELADPVVQYCNRCGTKHLESPCPWCGCPEFSLMPNVTSDGHRRDFPLFQE